MRARVALFAGLMLAGGVTAASAALVGDGAPLIDQAGPDSGPVGPDVVPAPPLPFPDRGALGLCEGVLAARPRRERTVDGAGSDGRDEQPAASGDDLTWLPSTRLVNLDEVT